MGFLGLFKGVGDILVLIGFGILLVMGLAGLGIVAIRAFRAIMHMEPNKFIIFLVFLSVGMIVLGTLISL